MMQGIRHFLVLILFFFFASNAFGQDENKSIELKKILNSIKNQYHVKFNYAEEDVVGHSIFPPPRHLPLKAILIYLSNRTGLTFRETGGYIIIYTSTKTETEHLQCAYVIDEFGQPIENAVVQFDGGVKVVTAADGYFEIPKKTQSVYVAQLGYQAAIVPAKLPDSNDCLEIVLPLTVQQLDEVVTERYLTTGMSKLKDGSFGIKPKKFGILPGLIEPDVLQAMQQLPGINSIDETVSNINVRGGSHDQNLFMWNGLRLFQTGHFFGLISALSPNLAHNIKISKNGTSAFYGESVSSAIDITSRPADIGTNTTSIGTNMISADFYTRIKTNKNANIELTARRSFTDVLAFPAYNKYSKRIFQNTVVTALSNSTDVNYKSDKEFYFYDFTAQYHQKIGKRHHFYTDVIGINNKLDFTQGTITQTNVVTKASGLDQLTLGATTLWRTKWNESHSTEVGIYGSYYNVDGINQSIEFNQITSQKNTILDAGLKLYDRRILTQTFTLHSGYQYNEIGIKNSDNINEPQYNRNVKKVLRTHALIGELEFSPENGRIFSRFGVRLNYIDPLGAVYTEPRMQFTYDIANNWKVEVLAEKKSQTASQVVELQADFLGIEKRRWVLADDADIPIQHSNQVSLGISYKNRGWLVSVDNFYKKVKGITSNGQAFQDQLELVQTTGSYTVYGTEFLVQKQFKDFYAWLSYTWNNNNYSFNGVEPKKFPSNFELAHTINCAAIYEWNNLKIALGGKWFTGRPVTPPLINVPVYSSSGIPSVAYRDPNSDHLGNFFQADFSASYTLKLSEKTSLQFGAAVLNIFDRKNIINTYYRINSNRNGVEMVNTYALERTPNAMVKLIF
ncbi:TonB-dependent receptor plug domain-containing protein [Flavobacterium sp. Sd200]|uniref:TonB-dependent receptor n=1 Tax=Flavobacterium sp. Sd200 TaxID=2692211 RepID=UPI0013716D9E|nr:TonB-dependent receptor plug domain-containing protein [Flavobacterium sp. Sd200]MXN92204.1 TonB-dependent receptor plug domain-containing protein [Flavobacterium sp. Sd200]